MSCLYLTEEDVAGLISMPLAIEVMEEAFRRLQRVASNRNHKLIEVAQTILIAEEAFQPPERR